MERNFKFTNLSGVILFYIVDFKYYPQYIIPHRTCKVNVQNY